MSVNPAPDQQRERAVALSPSTLELWLAAARYRRRADELARADASRPAL